MLSACGAQCVLFVYSLSGLLTTAQLFCSAVLSELMARDFEALELCRLVTVACTVCAQHVKTQHQHYWQVVWMVCLLSTIDSCHLKDAFELHAASCVEPHAVLIRN